MTRAEILAELASARRWLAEVRAGALRRAADLGRLRDRVKSGRTRAALQVAQRDLLAVGEAAENGLATLEGDLSALIKDL
jgi:hypothetical protein